RHRLALRFRCHALGYRRIRHFGLVLHRFELHLPKPRLPTFSYLQHAPFPQILEHRKNRTARKAETWYQRTLAAVPTTKLALEPAPPGDFRQPGVIRSH